MRIAFGTDNVMEILQLTVTTSFDEGTDVFEHCPDWYVVWIASENGCEPLGRYMLDGTEETYKKAVENFEEICNKLLIFGWCKDTDFENFEIYEDAVYRPVI